MLTIPLSTPCFAFSSQPPAYLDDPETGERPQASYGPPFLHVIPIFQIAMFRIKSANRVILRSKLDCPILPSGQSNEATLRPVYEVALDWTPQWEGYEKICIEMFRMIRDRLGEEYLGCTAKAAEKLPPQIAQLSTIIPKNYKLMAIEAAVS